MASKNRFITSLILGYCVFMNGCQPTQVAEGGIGGTGITSGSIDQFGSVFVNGTEFDTSKAAITIKGRSAGEDQLSLGMQVYVKGTINSDGKTGVAELLSFSPSLEEAIDSISADGSQLSINGYIVEVDNLTVFDGVARGALAVGDYVTVSGNRDSSNVIHATYIRRGIFESAPPTNGSNSSGGFDNGSSQPPQTDLWISLEGFVTHANSESEFVIGSSLVMVNDETTFINGGINDIAINAHLVVTGTLMADARIVAKQIEIAPNPTLNTSGPVTMVDADNSRIYLNGQAITITNTTLMIDNSSQHLRRFGLRQIGTGDQLVIDAFAANGQVIAARIERN